MTPAELARLHAGDRVIVRTFERAHGRIESVSSYGVHVRFDDGTSMWVLPMNARYVERESASTSGVAK